MVIFITGKGHSGKSTTALKLKRIIPNSVLIDSYDFRKHFPENDMTDQGRRSNVLTMARCAAILEAQGFVPIMACVAPYKKLRQEARKMFKESVIIYVPGGKLWKDTTYEEPDVEEIKDIVKLN